MIALLVAATAVPVCFGLLCRMDGLNIKRHKAAFVGLHLGLFLASFAAFMNGLQGTVTHQDGFVLLGSASWLALSWRTWANGAPEHAKRKPKLTFSEQPNQ